MFTVSLGAFNDIEVSELQGLTSCSTQLIISLESSLVSHLIALAKTTPPTHTKNAYERLQSLASRKQTSDTLKFQNLEQTDASSTARFADYMSVAVHVIVCICHTQHCTNHF